MISRRRFRHGCVRHKDFTPAIYEMNVLIMIPSSPGPMQRIQSERSILDDPDSPLEARAKILVFIYFFLFVLCL